MNPGSTSPEEIREPATRKVSPRREGKKRKVPKGLTGCFFHALLLLGIFVAVPAATLSMQHYNNTHPGVYRDCTVTAADPHHSISTHRKGSDSYKVRIETSDCGAYELAHGIDEDNYQDMAQKIIPGEYRLELAATAVAFEKVEKFFQSPVNIESLERAG